MALTKTSTIKIIDTWDTVAAGTMRVGADNAGGDDISGAYETLLLVEIAPISQNATEGMDFVVQISPDGVYWTDLAHYKSKAIAGATVETVSIEATAGQKIIPINEATSAAVGDKLFMKHSTTLANSEIVDVKDAASATQYEVASNLVSSYDAEDEIWSDAQQWVIKVPMSASKMRVLYTNSDADCDMVSQTKMILTTGL